jgi:hypothetical protein
MTLFVLAVGVFIGGAFGPRAADTLADGSDQQVVIVAGTPTAPALRPASPAAAAPSSAFGDTTAGAATTGSGSAAAAAAPQAEAAAAGAGAAAGAPEPSESAPTGPDVSGGGGTTGTGTTGTAPNLPPIKHVFTIALSTPGYDRLLGANGPPYLRSELAARGERLLNFHSITGGDLAGRIAMVSGQAPTPEIVAGCPTYGAGCLFPRTVKTVADQLAARGLAWRAYAGGLTTPCRHAAPGAPDDTGADRPGDHYAAASVPFLYFHSIIDTGDCNAGVVPVERLKQDLAAADTTPSFAFIAPDRCHDGRDGPCADGQPAGPAGADAFLREWLPAILASKAYRQDGLVIVVGGRGDRAGALLISRYAPAGRTVRTRYDQYALLRTVEDLFGLHHLGHAGDRSVASFGKDVFAA